MSIAFTPSSSGEECTPVHTGPVGLWVVLTVLSVLTTGWFSYKLLKRYAHPNIDWYYLVAVWVSWVLGFVGVFLLPLDMCITLATQCDSPDGVFRAWEFVYWTTFIMAWFVDPLLQSFHNDGSYDWQSRAKNAVKENVRFYVIVVGIIAGIVIALFILQIVDPAKIDLGAIIIGVANAYGLLLIILMLGYGIIAVPRDLWFYSKPEGGLERLYFLAPSVYEAAQDADYDLRIVVTAVENAAERARSNSHDGSEDDLRVFVEQLVRHVPHGVTGNGQSLENLMDVDMESVAKLHTKLLAASAKFENRAGEWERIVSRGENERERERENSTTRHARARASAPSCIFCVFFVSVLWWDCV